ncbi:MAG: hypothetical protein EOP83_01165 [Verrucomicrobiaceae bacterium]|nr:MAG: hypothetical protein EOP83_01165 [Verrucomicrobiaceae bacterium]
MDFLRAVSAQIETGQNIAAYVPIPADFDRGQSDWWMFVGEPRTPQTFTLETLTISGRMVLAMVSDRADMTLYGSGTPETNELINQHIAAMKNRPGFANPVGPTEIAVLSLPDLMSLPNFWEITDMTGYGYAVRVAQEETHFVIRS